MISYVYENNDFKFNLFPFKLSNVRNKYAYKLTEKSIKNLRFRECIIV